MTAGFRSQTATVPSFKPAARRPLSPHAADSITPRSLCFMASGESSPSAQIQKQAVR